LTFGFFIFGDVHKSQVTKMFLRQPSRRSHDVNLHERKEITANNLISLVKDKVLGLAQAFEFAPATVAA